MKIYYINILLLSFAIKNGVQSDLSFLGGSSSGTLSREMPKNSGIITSQDCSRIPLRHFNWLNLDGRELEKVKEREKERAMIVGIDRRQDQKDR